ncbi:MAG: hypothetical protein N2510_06245 [Ignavibacteria bacterium]|nr:hypothetical protein [Ignavibacteria bacterium]
MTYELTQKEILDKLKEKTNEYGIVCSFESKEASKNVHYGGGFSRIENVLIHTFVLTANNVKEGLPYFSINSKVFARNLIMLPFRLTGLAHRRIKTGISEIDRKIDLYFSRKTNREKLIRTYTFLLSEPFLKNYDMLINSGFKGTIEYDSLNIKFETMKIPENENHIQGLYVVIDVIKEIRSKLNEIN